jgi:biotin carboxylase
VKLAPYNFERMSRTIVCLASYFKGSDFIRECHAQGARVVVIVREKVRDEAWPRECIDQFVTVPNQVTSETFVQAVSEIARTTRIDVLVALEEYDVMHAAVVREHLRLAGMGTTTGRLFRDKLAMRVKAQEAGITVPDFVHVLNEDEISYYMSHVAPPWVLKPRSDVSAVGIQKVDRPELVWQAIAALDQRPALNERSSYYLLEQYVPGEVFHVDSLVEQKRVLFAGVHRYWRPPMDVAHNGGVFVTTTVARGSVEERALLAMNQALVRALGFVRGATHAEFIRGAIDGRFYFLEIAARVGGAYIAETLEAATGINLWREWARLELSSRERPYTLPSPRQEYGGLALSLARQEWPDTTRFADAEVAYRVHKRHHVGVIVRSPSFGRVQELLATYSRRIDEEFLAVLPPMERPQ